ncbi:hypothetical protein LTR78_007004 [Recurvomyces mirabilis]|uniref:Uncharacterized protein n=1 Tax=Recurvomyces mirabilis TaxID=574656 RepID=A0AAE0WK34_9PEZI|nr:hypothetical protein LTR78_007004 [Recurvomyces mirabilis]KAK5153388.1 hypothetical protein LTS14_007557 [Recurvomyces mirabilis]
MDEILANKIDFEALLDTRIYSSFSSDRERPQEEPSLVFTIVLEMRWVFVKLLVETVATVQGVVGVDVEPCSGPVLERLLDEERKGLL